LTDIPEDIKKMQEKISTLKKDCPAKEEKSEVSQLATALQIAIELVSGTFVGAGIGYILDELFDFKSIFLVIFTIFGSFAGLLNVARYIKKIEDKEE